MVRAPLFALAIVSAIVPAPGAAVPAQAHAHVPPAAVADPGRSPDAAFVAKASEATAVDAELATLASTHARASTVKALARQVLDGHTVLARELAAMGRTAAVAGAPGPEARGPDPAKGADPAKADAAPEPTSDGMKAVAALREQPPADFDAAFLAALITSRESAVALFEAESRDGRDGEVKEWAARQLPALREQLATARSLRTRPGSSRQVPSTSVRS